ncbi:hypothetical protein [Francisella sp. 19X1-34]|uniref:hypothetical protein n=1 Tax=Francisella sp. 19X1-34 TaxID=3087177 RepID=UPI002E312D77|nr:hypothetical protein [Francisella sp. 19X1-34]MED7788949.1 hypothetical protein [Francisella sp. 19X1-34]
MPQNVGIATNGIITINVGNSAFLGIPAPDTPVITNALAAIHLVPFIVNTTLIWSCENALNSTLDADLLPNSCLEETLVDLSSTCISSVDNTCSPSSNGNGGGNPNN